MSIPSSVIFQRGEEVLATLTLSCTFFFDAAARADALSDAVIDAVDLVKAQAAWYRAGTMSRNQQVDEEGVANSLQYVREALVAQADCYLMIDSGRPLDAVGGWSVKFGSSPSSEGENLGYFQVHVDHAQVPADVFHRSVRSWVEHVGFLHGYAGFAVNYDFGDVDPRRNAAMRGFCERYVGVSLTDLVTERGALHDGVKNASWLTFIGDALLSRHDADAQNLRAFDGAIATSNGVLLAACPAPLLGDRHTGEDVSAYIQVNDRLQPWLVDNLFPLPGFPDEEATRAYLHKLRPQD
jgi:hypothetical protein